MYVYSGHEKYSLPSNSGIGTLTRARSTSRSIGTRWSQAGRSEALRGAGRLSSFSGRPRSATPAGAAPSTRSPSGVFRSDSRRVRRPTRASKSGARARRQVQSWDSLRHTRASTRITWIAPQPAHHRHRPLHAPPTTARPAPNTSTLASRSRLSRMMSASRSKGYAR